MRDQTGNYLALIKVDNNNHGPATMHVNTGSQLQGSPSIGSWISYGLGSMNENLPSFVVLPDQRGLPPCGAANWGNGFLPAAHQGVVFGEEKMPIADLHRLWTLWAPMVDGYVERCLDPASAPPAAEIERRVAR